MWIFPPAAATAQHRCLRRAALEREPWPELCLALGSAPAGREPPGSSPPPRSVAHCSPLSAQLSQAQRCGCELGFELRFCGRDPTEPVAGPPAWGPPGALKQQPGGPGGCRLEPLSSAGCSGGGECPG